MKNKLINALKISLCLIFGVTAIIFTGGADKKEPVIQGVADTVRYNAEIKSPRLLIATQQSDYKDELIKRVIAVLKKEKINILVTDVTKLNEIKRSDWDAAIIITTVQSGKIQKDSHEFLENNIGEKNRIGLVYTTYSGAWKGKDLDIDAITSASDIVNVESIVKKIIDKSFEVLQLKK